MTGTRWFVSPTNSRESASEASEKEKEEMSLDLAPFPNSRGWAGLSPAGRSALHGTPPTVWSSDQLDTSELGNVDLLPSSTVLQHLFLSLVTWISNSFLPFGQVQCLVKSITKSRFMLILSISLITWNSPSQDSFTVDLNFIRTSLLILRLLDIFPSLESSLYVTGPPTSSLPKSKH